MWLTNLNGTHKIAGGLKTLSVFILDNTTNEGRRLDSSASLSRWQLSPHPHHFAWLVVGPPRQGQHHTLAPSAT